MAGRVLQLAKASFALLIKLLVVVHDELGVDLTDEVENDTNHDDHTGTTQDRLEASD